MQKIKDSSRGGALLWIVVFSVVILAIIVIAGIFALGNIGVTPTPSQTLSPSPTQTPTPTPTTPSLPPGLSIYQNQDPPFEFLYPEELRVSKDVRKSGTTISLEEKTPSYEGPFEPHFIVAFKPNLDGVDTAEYIENETRWKASVDTRMIGGYEAVALYLPGSDAPTRWVFAIDEDDGFGLWIFNITPALFASPTLPSTVDEIILTSFRFIR